jgi:uncharacterized protein HemX
MTPSTPQYWILLFLVTVAAGLVVVLIVKWLQQREDAAARKTAAEEEKTERAREASRQADVLNKSAARFRVVGDSEPPPAA